jgi:hypothetical protein
VDIGDFQQDEWITDFPSWAIIRADVAAIVKAVEQAI